MAIERLFSGETPANVNSDEGTSVILATGFLVSVPGNVIGIEFYTPTTLAASYTVALFETTDHDSAPGTGTLLGQAVKSSGLAGATWTDVMFDDPIPVVPDVAYRCCYVASNGRHNGTPSFFSGGPLIVGNLHAYTNGADPVGLGTLRNGTYKDSGSLIYPNDFFNATCYFVGPIFDNAPEEGGFDPRNSSMLLTF